MVEGSNLPVIEAREILERIERGEPVIYEHAAIAGDIDLSRLDLPFIETSGRRGKPYASRITFAMQYKHTYSHNTISTCCFLRPQDTLRSQRFGGMTERHTLTQIGIGSNA